jgi:hypothetical protein
LAQLAELPEYRFLSREKLKKLKGHLDEFIFDIVEGGIFWGEIKNHRYILNI